jgi:adenylate cyclase
MADLESIIQWLVNGAPGAAGPAKVVERLCNDLVELGIPIDRSAAFVRTLHPHVMGRAFVWRPGVPVTVREAPFRMINTPTYQNSPVHHTCMSGVPFRSHPQLEPVPRRFPMLDELASEGVTDYYVSPLRFLSGQVHAISFATKIDGGFTESQIAAFERITPPLARLAEILALTRTAVNLLDTYVGHNAGERIIQGRIARGDTDTIKAILWFSDLRGFTELASRIAPATLIGVLNDLFDCQVPAIDKHGGEVLKFMGDGLLAIFPIEGSKKTTEEIAAEAFAAADESFAALVALNKERTARADEAIKFGLALHIGEVAYGNIGGANRLDFTCIGPAVNLAARLEGLTGRLGKPVVVSGELAALAKRELVRVGAFELKGVPGVAEVFGAPEGDRLASFDPR